MIKFILGTGIGLEDPQTHWFHDCYAQTPLLSFSSLPICCVQKYSHVLKACLSNFIHKIYRTTMQICGEHDDGISKHVGRVCRGKVLMLWATLKVSTGKFLHQSVNFLSFTFKRMSCINLSFQKSVLLVGLVWDMYSVGLANNSPILQFKSYLVI